MTKSAETIAVIFDMDGVIADSIRPHYETWESVAKDLGGHLEYEDFRRLFGQAYPAYFPKMHLAAAIPDDEQRRWSKIKEERYRDLIAGNFPLIPGVDALIGELAKANFQLAIGSSGPRENVELAIASLASGKNFRVYTCSDDVKNAKPAPDVFLKAAEKLQIAPTQCVVIEDSVHGLIAAKRAGGMKTIGITTTSPRAELSAQADLLVDKMAEISAAKILNLFA